MEGGSEEGTGGKAINELNHMEIMRPGATIGLNPKKQVRKP